MRPSLSLIEESGRPSIVNFGKPDGGVGLDPDQMGIDTEDGGGERRGEHAGPSRGSRVGEPAPDCDSTVGPRCAGAGPPRRR